MNIKLSAVLVIGRLRGRGRRAEVHLHELQSIPGKCPSGPRRGPERQRDSRASRRGVGLGELNVVIRTECH